MDENELYDDSERSESEQGVAPISGTTAIKPITAETGIGLGSTPTQSNVSALSYDTPTSSEESAKEEALLQVNTHVARVNDNLPNEEFVSTKDLYEKNLGITQYEELRDKLHLAENESFTEYYERTGYVPEGFEVQAKLLIAEEKRKKLHAEVEAGNMSEEDFLYEAYGKDLLKQQGIDFTSSLYWYNRYQSGDYSDPKDNPLFWDDLIKSARTIFQAEQWYEAVSSYTAKGSLAAYVTGDELSVAEIEKIFSDQFEVLTQYYESAEQIVKYYKAGYLKDFTPTIDINNDGKIDYYLAPNGKLYNVNETGEGANTMKAYYDDGGNLIRIVASDSVGGEVFGEALKGIGRFFTDVIDLVPMLIGVAADVIDGGQFGDTVAEWMAGTQAGWNSTALGDIDYIAQSGWTTESGESNGAVIGRQASRLAGTILSFIAVTVATWGIGTAAQAATKAASTSSSTLAKVALKATSGTLKYGVGTALKLTSWSNGIGASSGVGATAKALVPIFVRDTVQNIAVLSINQKKFGLSDNEVVLNSLASSTMNFGVSMALRSVVDDGAIRRWAKSFSKPLTSVQKTNILLNRSGPYISKTLAESAGLTVGQRLANKLYSSVWSHMGVGVGNMALDSLENFLTAWTQTSLSTSGQVFDTQAAKALLNNPQFAMNMVFQGVMNASDEFKIKGKDLVGLGFDVAKMETDFRKMCDDGISSAATAAEEVVYKDLILAFDNRLKENINSGLSRQEASIKTLNEFTSELGLNADSALFQKWGKYTKDAISEQALLTAEMQIQYANEIQKAYANMGKNILTKGFSNVFYGSAFKKMSSKLMEGFQKSYLSAGFSTLDINEQIARDTAFGRAEVYSDIFNELGTIGDDILEKEIEIEPAVGGTQQVKLKSGKTVNVPITILDSLSDKGKTKYAEVISKMGDQDKLNMYQSFLLKIPSEGNASDAAITQKDAMKYLSTLNQMLIKLNGGQEQIFYKLSDSEYYLSFTGMGDTALNIEQVRLFVKGMANLKAALNSTNPRFNAAEAVQLVFQTFFSDKLKASTAIQDNPDLIPMFVHELVANNIFTKKEVSKLIGKLEETYGKTGLVLPNAGETNFETYDDALLLKDFMTKWDNVADLLQKDVSKLTAKEKGVIKRFTAEFPKDHEAVTKAMDKENKIITEEDYDKLSNLTFQSGQIENSLQGKNAEVNSLVKLISQDTNDIVAEQEEAFNKLFQGLLVVDKTVSDTTLINIRNSKKRSTRTVFLKDLHRYKDFKDYRLSDQEKKILTPLVKQSETLLSRDYIDNLATKASGKGFTPQQKDALLAKYDSYTSNNINSLVEAFSVEDPYLKNVIYKKLLKLDDLDRAKYLDIGLECVNRNIDYKEVRDFIFHNTSLLSSLENKYNIIHKHQKDMPSTKTIRINPAEFKSPLQEQVDRKIARNPVARRVIDKQNTKDIIKEVFDGDSSKYYKWMAHNKLVSNFITSHGLQPVDFKLEKVNGRLTNPELEALFKNLDRNLNSYLYQPDAYIPGCSYTDGSYGILFTKDIEALQKDLFNLAEQDLQKNKSDYTTFRHDNVLNLINTLSSGINYIDPASKIKWNEIPSVFIDGDNLKTIIGASTVQLDNDMKLGKAASSIRAFFGRLYSGIVATDTTNTEIKRAMFVKDIIEIVSQLYDDKNKNYRTPMVFEGLTKKQIDDLKILYDVSRSGKKTIVTFKESFKSSADFKKVAYDLIKQNGLQDLNQILPTYTLDLDRHNHLTKEGMGKADFSGAYQPIHWFEEQALDLYSDTYSSKEFRDFKGIPAYDLSDEAQTAALNYINTRTFNQLISEIAPDNVDIPKDNIFYQMGYNAAKVQMYLSDSAKKGLDLYNINADSSKLLTLLCNADNRANFAVAVSNSLKDTDFYHNNLIISDELINRVINNYSDVYSKTAYSKQNIYASSNTNLDVVSGSQFTPQRVVPDLSKETIKELLELLDIHSTTFTPVDVIEDSVYLRLANFLAKGESLNGFTAYKDLALLSKEDIRTILDTCAKHLTLESIETLMIMLNTKIDYDGVSLEDTYLKVEQPEKLSPSVSTEHGTIIDNTPEAIKKSFEDSKRVDYLRNRVDRELYSQNYLKISQASDPRYKHNKLMRKISEDLRQYASENLNYVGSIQMSNMNRYENLVAFKHNLTNYSIALKNMFPDMSADAAMNVAYKCYIYSAGIEMQDIHPDYLFIHSKTGEVMEDVGLSGTYYDESVNTLNLLRTKYLDENLELRSEYKDIVMIKLDRNMLSSSYADSISELHVYPLETNEGKIRELLVNRIQQVIDSNNLQDSSEDVLIDAVEKYYYKAWIQTQKSFVEQLKDINTSDQFDADAMIDLYANVSGLSFTSLRRTLLEETMYRHTSENKDSLGDYYKINDTELKEQELFAHGITKESLYKKEGTEETIDDINNTLEDAIDNIRKTNKLYANQSKALVDAMITDNESNKNILFDKLLSNKKLTTQDLKKDLATQLLLRYIIDSPTLDMDIVKLNKNLLELRDQYTNQQNPNIVINRSQTGSIDLNSLKNTSKLGLDIEGFYDEKGTYPFQIGIVDIDGKEYSIYKKVEGVNTPDDIVNKFPDFTRKYWKEWRDGKEVIINEGMATAIEGYFKQMETGENISELYTILDKSLEEINKQGSIYLVGFNSEKFDIEKLTTGPNPIIDPKKYAALLEHHIDVSVVRDQNASYKTLDTFGGKAKLEKTIEQYGESLKGSHNGVEDVKGTLKLLDLLINDLVDNNKYMFRSYKDLDEIWFKVTGEKDSTEGFNRVDAILKESLADYTIPKNLSEETTKIIARHNDTNRLNSLAKVINALKNKDAVSAYQARHKSLTSQLADNRSSKELLFAKTFKNKRATSELLDIISFKLKDITSKDDIDLTLNTLVHSISSKSKLDDILETLSVNSDDLYALFKTTKQEVNDWLLEHASAKQELLSKLADTYGDDLLTTESKTAAAHAYIGARKIFDDELKGLPLNATAKQHVNELLQRVMDGMVDNEGKIPMFSADSDIDMLSNFDHELIDLLQKDPILSRKFSSIYQKAQTVVGKKVKLLGKGLTYLRSDTFYMTPERFCEVFGLQTNLGLNPEDLLKEYGSADGSILLPVIRHPGDRPHSINGFRIELLDPKAKENRGLTTAINIDIYRQIANGDLDGDATTILKPYKEFSEYFSQIIDDTYLVNRIMDKALEPLYDNIKYKDNNDMIANLAIHKDSNIIISLIRDLRFFTNMTSGDISQEYKTRKELFINKHLDAVQKKYNISKDAAIDCLDDIYLKKPIDISDSLKIDTPNRFVVFTDCIGLLQNDLNIKAKRAYMLHQLAYHDVLSYKDTVTGMFQKGYLTQDLSKFGAIDFETQAFLLSSTTRSILNNNLTDDFKSNLINEITSSEYIVNSTTKSMRNTISKLITKAEDASDIEQAIRLLQIATQDSYNKSVTQTMEKLITTDTPYKKFYNHIMSKDPKDKWFTDLNTIVNVLNKISGDRVTKPYDGYQDGINYLKNKVAYNEAKNIINYTDKDNLNQNNIYKKVKVTYMVDDFTIIPEDNFAPLEAMDKLQGVHHDISDSISDKNLKLFNTLELGDMIEDPHLLSLLGIPKSAPYNVFFGEIRNNKIIFARGFGLEDQKLYTLGDNASKATGTKMLLSEELPEDIKDFVKDSVELRAISSINYKKLTSLYDSKGLSYVIKLKDGTTKTEFDPADIGNIRAITVDDALCLLEANKLWDHSYKETSFDALTYGNNILSAPGQVLLEGVMCSVKDDKLYIDTSDYVQRTELLETMNMPKRYHRNSLDLVQKLQASVLIKYLDLDVINKLYNTEFASKDSAIDYLYNNYSTGIDIQSEIKRLKRYLPGSVKLNNFEQLLFSTELMQKFGTGRLTEGSQHIKQINKKPIKLKESSASHSPSSVTGKIMTLDDHIDLSTEGAYYSVQDFINFMNTELDTKAYFSSKNLKVLEQYNMLLHGLIKPKELGDTNVLNPKIGNSIDNPMLKTYGPTLASAERQAKGLKYSDEFAEADIASGRVPGAVTKNGLRPYILDQYIDKETGRFTSPSFGHQPARRLAIALRSLLDSDGSEVGIAQRLSPLHQNAQVALSTITTGFDRDIDTVAYQPIRQHFGRATLEQTSDLLFKESTSPYYFEQFDKFKEKSSSTTKSVLEKPVGTFQNTEDLDTNKRLEELIASGGISKTSTTLTEDQENIIRTYEQYAKLKSYDDVIKTRGDYFSGNIGRNRTMFKASRFSLNEGLKLDSADALRHTTQMQQLRISEQNYRGMFETDIIRLNNICEEIGCVDQIDKYAYVLGLVNQQKIAERSITKDPTKISNNASRIVSSINDIYKELGIENPKEFLKAFEKKNPRAAKELSVLLSKMNKVATQFSSLMDEPTNNIFFALLPTSKPDAKSREAGAKYLINMMSLGQLANHENIPAYTGYNLFASLNSTITTLSKQAAIYENSMRLKMNGDIDSIQIQDTLVQTIEDNYDMIARWDADDKKLSLYKNLINIITGHATETINDPELNKILQLVEYELSLGEAKTITVGEAYLHIYEGLNEYLTKQEYSLSEAVALLNSATTKVEKENAMRIIYAHEQRQDIFAQLDAFSGDKSLTKSMYSTLQRYADNNGLALVDKYGRLLTRDTYYKFSENSLSYISEFVKRETNGFENTIIEMAVGGDLFFMDKTLAEVYANKVFVKQAPTKLRKILKGSAGWCVKWLMGHPLKLVNRMLKFTAFDFATLATANHNTAFKSPEALLDLRQYFSSKGQVVSDSLREFLNTQGVSVGSSMLDMLSSNDIDATTKMKFGQKYFDKVNDMFTEQTLFQRYAYWLATKKALEKTNPDYSVLGSAYHLKDSISKLDSIKDVNGNERVSKAGNQAAFAMSQLLGGPNTFPSMATTLNQAGFTFTTFPLAGMRWGVGELRSIASAFSDLFSSGSKKQGATWLVRNSGGILMTFIMEQVLIGLICDMFGIDDEREEEWKEAGAMLNLTDTLIQGEPIMDTFSSMNMSREFYALTLEPFVNKKDNDSDTASGLEKYFSKHILSHINPLVKNGVELITQKDFIDDQIIDTSEKYSMFENLARKASSYILGASGANAMIRNFKEDSSDSLVNKIYNSARSAISAEMGNTKTYKENNKNYYKMLKLINAYKYKDYKGTLSTTDSYNGIKNRIYNLLNNRASPIKVYEEITDLIQAGYDVEEIRAALNSCSISYKIDSLPDPEEFLSTLSDAELQNLKSALAYENKIYPWLEEYSDSLKEEDPQLARDALNRLKYSSYTPKSYYSNYSPKRYMTYNPDYNTYPNLNNYNRQNAYATYNNTLNNIQYQQRQAEYEANKKKWSDD